MSADAPKGLLDSAPRVLSMPPQSGTTTPPEQPSNEMDVNHGAVGDDHLNTDERELGKWKSRYPKEARDEIRIDAIYVAVVLTLTLLAILLTWRGTVFDFLAQDCTTCSRSALDRYAYFYLGGQLGGTLFGVKYLYNVVARGWWNIDRRLWRLFSPFLSAGLALAVGALIDAGVLGLSLKASSEASYFSLGFVAGYFADSALRKMKEIADTIFGSPEKHSNPPTGSNQ